MKIRQITNQPVIIMKNGQNKAVSFSGKKSQGMPKIKRETIKNGTQAGNNIENIFKDIGKLIKDIGKSIKKSYEKSDLRKLFMKTDSENIKKITPGLKQALKGAVILATGVGLYEVVRNKVSDN